MSDPRLERPILSHRNHLNSLDDQIDLALARLDFTQPWTWTPETVDRFRSWVRSFGVRLIRLMAMDFEKGAERGVEQAANLLLDPAYYDTIKRRRKAELAKFAERRKEQRLEAAEREAEVPTEAELIRRRHHLEWSAQHCRDQLSEIQAELATLGSPERIMKSGTGEAGKIQ